MTLEELAYLERTGRLPPGIPTERPELSAMRGPDEWGNIRQSQDWRRMATMDLPILIQDALISGAGQATPKPVTGAPSPGGARPNFGQKPEPYSLTRSMRKPLEEYMQQNPIRRDPIRKDPIDQTVEGEHTAARQRVQAKYPILKGEPAKQVLGPKYKQLTFPDFAVKQKLEEQRKADPEFQARLNRHPTQDIDYEALSLMSRARKEEPEGEKTLYDTATRKLPAELKGKLDQVIFQHQIEDGVPSHSMGTYSFPSHPVRLLDLEEKWESIVGPYISTPGKSPKIYAKGLMQTGKPWEKGENTAGYYLPEDDSIHLPPETWMSVIGSLDKKPDRGPYTLAHEMAHAAMLREIDRLAPEYKEKLFESKRSGLMETYAHVIGRQHYMEKFPGSYPTPQHYSSEYLDSFYNLIEDRMDKEDKFFEMPWTKDKRRATISAEEVLKAFLESLPEIESKK